MAETSLQVGVETAATIPESEPPRRRTGHSGEEEVKKGTLQKPQDPLMREKWSWALSRQKTWWVKLPLDLPVALLVGWAWRDARWPVTNARFSTNEFMCTPYTGGHVLSNLAEGLFHLVYVPPTILAHHVLVCFTNGSFCGLNSSASIPIPFQRAFLHGKS